MNSVDPVQAWDRRVHLLRRDRASTARSRRMARSCVRGTTGTLPSSTRTTSSRRSSSEGRPRRSSIGRFEDKVELEADRGLDALRRERLRLLGAVHRVGRTTGLRRPVNRRRPHVQQRAENIGGRCTETRRATSPSPRTGTVYVSWRQFAFKANQGQQQRDADRLVRSTDGGASFTKPRDRPVRVHNSDMASGSNPSAEGRPRRGVPGG